MKKKLKLTTILITMSLLLGIVAMIAPVKATNPNRILMVDIMAKGDDIDPGFAGATNFIMAKIKDDKVHIEFNQKIYESGKKVYMMIGKLQDGLVLTTNHYFYCPIFNVWWINVTWVMGEGMFKTTDTNFEVFFRNSFPITMPNTEGKYVSAQILMFLSPTAKYYEADPDDPMNPATIPWDEEPLIWEGGGWALVGAIWEVETPFGPMELPVGPASCLTNYMEHWFL
ncbi:MAG: hypothetical protein ACFFBH_02240 [Promethearchaeota archaeon]